MPPRKISAMYAPELSEQAVTAAINGSMRVADDIGQRKVDDEDLNEERRAADAVDVDLGGKTQERGLESWSKARNETDQEAPGPRQRAVISSVRPAPRRRSGMLWMIREKSNSMAFVVYEWG